MPQGLVGLSNRVRALFPSAARAVAQAYNSTNQEPVPNTKRLIIVIDATAATATPSVVPKIQGYDPFADKYFDLLAGAAITGTGTTVLMIGPGITPSTNVAAAVPVPPIYRVILTHADTDSITYSVTALEGE
jgi:hypothetical protein